MHMHVTYTVVTVHTIFEGLIVQLKMVMSCSTVKWMVIMIQTKMWSFKKIRAI